MQQWFSTVPGTAMDWSTKDFLKEIDDVAQLYALSSCSSMATSMIASLGKKLSTAVSLRAGDYVFLMQHVDGSKLPEEQKLELQKTLGQVASSNGQQSVANKLVKGPQSMPNVPAYLSYCKVIWTKPHMFWWQGSGCVGSLP